MQVTSSSKYLVMPLKINLVRARRMDHFGGGRFGLSQPGQD